LIVGHPIYPVAQDASFWSLPHPTRFAEDFQFCLDVEFFLRSVGGGTIVMSPRALSFFREHPASKTSLIYDVGRQEHARLLTWMEGRGASAAEQADIVRRWRRQNLRSLLTLGRQGSEFSYVHPKV
jgi:hypothetical protein